MSRNGSSEKASCSLSEKSHINFERDIVALLETNVDDITGEVLSRAIERLLEEGAEDASATPYLGKKGREGFTVRVVCSRQSQQRIAEVLVAETGTLGVKITECSRLIVPRKLVPIPFSSKGFDGTVRVKIAKARDQILRIKPELDDARIIADQSNVPLRDILEQITSVATKYVQDHPELVYEKE